MSTRTLPPRGVCYGGMHDVTPPLTDAQIAAQIAAIEARTAEDEARWLASPHRRFVVAVAALEALGWTEEGQRARHCMSRGFRAPEQVTNPEEVGAALKVLAGIDHSHAREAVAALGEVLTVRVAA